MRRMRLSAIYVSPGIAIYAGCHAGAPQPSRTAASIREIGMVPGYFRGGYWSSVLEVVFRLVVRGNGRWG